MEKIANFSYDIQLATKKLVGYFGLNRGVKDFFGDNLKSIYELIFA
jgi:hypothetical protein